MCIIREINIRLAKSIAVIAAAVINPARLVELFADDAEEPVPARKPY
jgi:hypothetical protein